MLRLGCGQCDYYITIVLVAALSDNSSEGESFALCWQPYLTRSSLILAAFSQEPYLDSLILAVLHYFFLTAQSQQPYLGSLVAYWLVIQLVGWLLSSLKQIVGDGETSGRKNAERGCLSNNAMIL